MANHAGSKTRWPSRNVGRISFPLIPFSYQKNTLSQAKESFIFPVSTLVLRKADPGFQSLLEAWTLGEKPVLLRRDQVSVAVNKRPALATPSHLRSQNILQGDSELLHHKCYCGKTVSFGVL